MAELPFSTRMGVLSLADIGMGVGRAGIKWGSCFLPIYTNVGSRNFPALLVSHLEDLFWKEGGGRNYPGVEVFNVGNTGSQRFLSVKNLTSQLECQPSRIGTHIVKPRSVETRCVIRDSCSSALLAE